MTYHNDRKNLGRIIKQQRVAIPLTLTELSARSGVSPSHLSRIEKGERFPSAHILQRIARLLGFEENELFTLAGYLSPPSSIDARKNNTKQLDPIVTSMLAREPIEIQRTVIAVLTILKSINRRIK